MMNWILNRFGPAQLLVLGFLGIILLGAALLMLPVAAADGSYTNFLNALFTATSAICVTGLVVVDTAAHWSLFGELVILTLIQVGGLGIMTFAALFALLLGKKIGFKERLLLQEQLNRLSVAGVVKLVRQILLTTITIESFGALILTFRFLKTMPLPQAVYYGIFHSISAFNNAGFDLFGVVSGKFSSLTSFTGDPVVSLTIVLLFIIGGLGFSVIFKLSQKRGFKKKDLHTKSVVYTTLALLGTAFIAVLILEWNNPQTMGQLSPASKMLAGFFQAATPRTAGFNTLDTASLRMPTQFLIIILMFIGASPGSTGGGIKTTTFASIIFSTRATLVGKDETTAFGRTIPRGTIAKATAILFVALSWIVMVTLLLTITENTDFLSALFETTSAFGTVGLSMGLTTKLSVAGRVLITLTMFLGRVGPLTLMYALTRHRAEAKYRYPEDHLLIG